LTGPPVRLELRSLRWHRRGALSYEAPGFVLGKKALELAVNTVDLPPTLFP
jgi:hypothetical protein